MTVTSIFPALHVQGGSHLLGQQQTGVCGSDLHMRQRDNRARMGGSSLGCTVNVSRPKGGGDHM